MIAALLAAAALAGSTPSQEPQPPPQMQITLTAQDLSFLEDFLSGYAGQGCNIQTQQGVIACEMSTKALEVWRVLKAATPVPVQKAK